LSAFRIEEELQLKIAITSKGKDLDSQMDPRFGRATYILIVDTLNHGFKVLDNSENVNAFKTLNAAGIKVANDVTGTVRDAVIAYSEGKVSFADGANAEGSW
jgi:predicted Fe-Mo cluster-binding NifX family protein